MLVTLLKANKSGPLGPMDQHNTSIGPLMIIWMMSPKDEGLLGLELWSELVQGPKKVQANSHPQFRFLVDLSM